MRIALIIAFVMLVIILVFTKRPWEESVNDAVFQKMQAFLAVKPTLSEVEDFINTNVVGGHVSKMEVCGNLGSTECEVPTYLASFKFGKSGLICSHPTQLITLKFTEAMKLMSYKNEVVHTCL